MHAASCMNQKHLLRFIKKKMRKHSDDVVCKNRDGSTMTLLQVGVLSHVSIAFTRVRV